MPKKIPPIPQQDFLECMRSDIFWITKCIAVGPYPEEHRHTLLQQHGVTHVVNVSEYRNNFCDTNIFNVAWIPIEDLKKIPHKLLKRCLETIHTFLQYDKSNVYIHCVAGQNRSPNIIWLYLIACGVCPQEARNLMNRATLDTVVGHPLIVDAEHIEVAKKHGQKNFLPLKRLEIVQPSFTD